MAEGRIKLRTTLGDIEVELWPKEAPKACRKCARSRFIECRG